MKTIVVYYSLEGNTKYMAEAVAENLRADILCIEPVRTYPTGATKYFFGGKDVVMSIKPQLKKYQADFESYDTIVIGSPIWAGSFAPPINTLLSENDFKGKNMCFFACSDGGSADKCFDKLKKETGAVNAPTLRLVSPKKKYDEHNTEEIKAFCEKIRAMYL